MSIFYPMEQTQKLLPSRWIYDEKMEKTRTLKMSLLQRRGWEGYTHDFLSMPCRTESMGRGNDYLQQKAWRNQYMSGHKKTRS